MLVQPPATLLPHVIWQRFAIGIMLLCWVMSAGAQNLSRYPFSVVSEPSAGGHWIIGRNDGPAPVSVRLVLEGAEQVIVDRPLPAYALVPPHGMTYLARTQPRSSTPYSYRVQSRWNLGDYTATPAPDVAYRLPFRDGLSFRISQAPSGPITSHTTADSAYAVDFPMPEGTPIVAIADGVVINVEEGQTEGGQRADLMTKANVIRILHRDGSVSVYGHLSYRGVLVAPGQQVRAGQTIGLSGSTGFSSGPHLHLAVTHLTRTEQGFASVSLPFRFYVGNPPVSFSPAYGMQATANYQTPGQIPPIVVRPPANTTSAATYTAPVTTTAPAVRSTPYLPPGVSPR